MLFAAGALLSGCGSSGPTDPVDEAGRPLIEMPALWAAHNGADLQTLSAYADAVFVGRVTGTQPQRMERLIPGVTEGPRAQEFPISVFDVYVESAIAGAPATGSVVAVEQEGGIITAPDGAESRIQLEANEWIEVGTTYMFFATVKPNGAYTTAPFGRFRIGLDGAISALPGWGELGAANQLAGLGVNEAKSEIAAAAR